MTIEAMALLVMARILVAYVPLARWRRTLGAPIAPRPEEPSLSPTSTVPADRRLRRLVHAVERAAVRLPGENRCLAKAMALQWMLRRRGLSASLVIGVLPGQRHGALRDLHAWVEREGTILIGESDQPHQPIYASTTDFSTV